MEFRGQRIDDEELRSRSTNSGRWRHLSLINTSCTDSGLRELLERCKNLEELELSSECFSDTALESLSHLHRLKSVLIRDCPRLTDRGMELVCRVRDIRELYFAGTGLTGEGLRVISDLESLNALVIDDCVHITESAFGEVSFPGTLTLFHLAGTRISADRWPACGLTHLNLSNTPVRDSGIASIVSQTGDSLRWLDLAGTQISDAAFVELARLERLETLSIARTRVTDSALNTLVGLSQLQRLVVTETDVTAPALDSLLATNRKLSIEDS